MTFYLKPPHGTIPLHRLLELAETRLNFLHKIRDLHENEDELDSFLTSSFSVQDSECLIEGNVKDTISHFILRLSCVSTNEMSEFFLEAESVLFKLRLKSMTSRDLLRLSHDLHRQAVELKRQFSGFATEQLRHRLACLESLDVLHAVSQQLNSNLGRRSRSGDERKKNIKVPFQYILPLVSSRSVTLTLGFGLVPLDQVDVLLEVLFKQHLALAMEELKHLASSSELFEVDPRINEVNRVMMQIFIAHKREHSPNKSTFSQPMKLLDIDRESNLFPLCMRFLHERLRRNHRLKHLSRIQYTLFLKEVGLPIEDALNFWKEEYSLPTGVDAPGQSSSSCNHNWQGRGSRYRYSIRHLYGLEGSRRSYTTHSCQQIHNRVLGPLEEAGCPFLHFDEQKLLLYLENVEVADSDRRAILSLVGDGSPSAACNFYLKSRLASPSKLASSGGCSSVDLTSSESGESKKNQSHGIVDVESINGFGKGTMEICPANAKVFERPKQKSSSLFSRPSEFYFNLSHFTEALT